MKAHQFFFALSVVLFVLLVVSLAANLYILALATQYYTQLNQVHLDPLGLNQNISTASPLLPGQTRIVFFGDSRAQDWPEPLVGNSFQFINRGKGGQTSVQVLGRFAAQVAPLKPDIVILQVGVNDLKTIPIFPDEKIAIMTTCLANVGDIVKQATNEGATVILTTIFPVAEATLERLLFFWSDAVAPSISEVNDSLRAMAGDRVIVLDAYALTVGGNGLTRPEYAADTLHLNANGYAMLNRTLAELLTEIPQPER